MTASDDLRRGMKRVRNAADRVVRAAAEGGDDGSRINVARRTNIKVAKNVGHDDGTAHASATQHAPIIQDGNGAGEEGTTNGRPSE